MAVTMDEIKARRKMLDAGAGTNTMPSGGGVTMREIKARREKVENKNLYAEALDSYRANNNLGFAPDVSPSQATPSGVASSPEGRAKNLSPAQSADGGAAGSSPNRGAKNRGIATGSTETEGSTLVQKYKASIAPDSQQDDFDKLNQWFDTGDNRNLADAVRRVDSTHGAYTDTDLIRNGGWTKAQIDEARQKNAAYDAIPAWQRATRRTANTIGGIGDTVAAAPILGVEYGKQAGKDIAETRRNWEKVEQEVQNNPRAKRLYDLLTEVDMDYQPVYPESRNRELVQMGYGSEEIRKMRNRLAGLEVSRSIDPDESLGYQLYKRGQDLTAAAQSGLTPAARAAQGVVTSAAENLAVAAVNPAAVLPVLSAQGAAEAMGQSAEAGTGAGKALGGGLAKFAAGWGINSVGAADLAKSMGSDYAKDTVAGQIADWVRGLAGDSAFAKQYPAAANAISGGIDNAMQAFVETYADKAIDATLMGDAEAAQTLFDKDTFLTALESGLSGGASGALGGAVGTGLAKMNSGDASWAGQADYYDTLDKAEKALNEILRQEQRVQEPVPSQATPDGSPLSLASLDSSPEGRALGRPAQSELDAGSLMEQKSVGPAVEGSGSGTANLSPAQANAGNRSRNPAVRQFAQAADAEKLTGKTIRLFSPGEGNAANRAAFEEAYGVQLPDTTSGTRRMLRDIAAQQVVENAGERVESNLPGRAEQEAGLPSQSTPDGVTSSPEGRAKDVEVALRSNDGESGAEAENAPLRETYGMQAPQSAAEKQREVKQQLERWGVPGDNGKAKVSQEISQKMPKDVDAGRYAAAANTLYRLGQMEDVETFSDALRLAGSETATALNVNTVLASETGRNALETAYVYGKDTVIQKAGYGGRLTNESISGQGETFYRGTMRSDSDVGSQIIELNARATGTDAILKNVLQNEAGKPDSRVRAYLDSATGRIFFGDSANDVFGTVLHEDYHWYNTLDSEGAQAVQQHALEYLARMDGYESVDELIRSKVDDYAAQGLTYEQAAEELVADAWSGIFSTEADFKRWVEFQRGQAEKNAGEAGTVKKVMTRIREMLTGILNRAKEVLAIDPENRAAMKAKRLAEAERKILQDEYFAHAETAMDNLRAAKADDSKNAAALKTEDAAEKLDVRYAINPDYAQDIDEWAEKGRNENRSFVLGKTGDTLQKLGARVNDIYMNSSKINTILKEHPEMTLEEIKRIPEILDDPVMVLTSQNKGRTKQNTRLVMFGSVKAQDGRPILCVLDLMPVEKGIVINDMQKLTSAYTKDNNPVGFVRNSTVLYAAENEKRTTTLLRLLGFQLPIGLQRYGSIGSITYEDGTVKFDGVKFTSLEKSRTDEPVKKSIRFQLGAPVEVNGQKDLVAVHNLTEENLREALDLGGMPSPSIAVVKAQEGHTKYGPISLVFAPDAIDPMANNANRIYGSDAWTPTRPNVEYEVHYDAMNAFENKVDRASREAFDGKFKTSAVVQSLGVGETSDMSRAELAQRLQEKTAVQLAYLEANGKTVEPVYKTEQDSYDALGNDALEKVIEYAGADEIRNAFESGDMDQLERLADRAADALEENYTHGTLKGQNKRWQMRITKLRNENRGRLYGLIEHAYKMLTDSSGGKQVLDVEATRDKIRDAAPASAVKDWVYAQLDGVLGQKGIRNQKDRFTPGGKSRSFAQLHNPYTLENLVAAMNQQEARGKGAFGLSASTLMSTATAEYQNLDEVRADKSRLQQMPETEYKALLEQADGQIEDVIASIRQETAAHADNSFEEREILGDILLRAAQGKRTAAAITRAFSKEGYAISRETAQKILLLYQNIAQIPTGYFEAKPQRAVDFAEVRAAIVPDNTSARMMDTLKEKGITVYEYPAGNDTKRTELLNRVPDVRFQRAEQADREAKKNTQRQASRVIADNAAAIETLRQMMGLTRGVRISEDSILGKAEMLVKASGAKGKADTEHIAREIRTLIEYMKTEGADMNKAQGLAETIAGEILDSATYRNTELWQQYPEYHELSYTVNKSGQAKAELVRQYGSWGEAVAEARKHGVKLRQEEGYRDGNPAEQYESIVNDTRSTGGGKDGAAALFRNAAKAAGVDGASSMESTEWLDVLMNVHDAIKPRIMSRFADVAEYEDAKVELAGRMIGELLNVPEMTDAQAIWESFQRWQRNAVAAAAADETSAAEAVKNLKAVQKEQTREFNRRLYENQKSGNQTEAVKQLEEQLRRNAKAEKLLDENLKTLGVDITNVGDLNEKLTFLRESYEREWKAEKKRLREERQEMLDEIRLENKTLKAENRTLSKQVAQEQQRADRAEYAQIVQEREIMEWEVDNQRKADEWQRKQAERNAIAMEVVRQQRDEDIAIAKALADKRVQRARDGRKADELKRSIRNNAAQLNQMILHPAKGKYVQPRLIQQAAEAAKLADSAILNDRAVGKLTALANTIRQTQGSESDPSSLAYDWEQTGVPKMIAALQLDLTNTKQAKLDRLNQKLTEAEALGSGEAAEKLRDRLRRQIRETEAKTFLPMTVEQLQLLKAITAGTLHVIRTENKTVSLAKTEAVDAFAQKAGLEVLGAKGNEPGQKRDRLRDALTKYNLDLLGAKRVFRMLGGYTKNGQMERLANMLNDGQLRQTQILVEGTKLFDNVTGTANEKQMRAFAGPGAELVDIGLKDTKGNAVPLTHAQLCSLYMHLRNKDSLNHLLNGGLTLPDVKLYHEGKIERAYQMGQTVQIGMLMNADGTPMADNILQTVEKALTDYDRAWIEDMKGFFGSYTTNLINETSMKLVGFARATVKDYYPIAVNKSQLASEIEGLKHDATIEGRGFLKERVKSTLPILLEECSSVVQRSLRDTAAYAGLAAPIRDANRILNADVELRDGVKRLKSGIIKEHWGQDAANYIDYLLTDLQSTRRKREDGISRTLGKMRSNYAGSVLTLNPGVAIAQAASLPTAAAVLGADTMAAVVPFVKNFSAKQRAALEAEIAEHGDALLQYRMRGSKKGELASIGVEQTFMDKLPKKLTGWINGMDEITVAALWEGAKRYVEKHPETLSVAYGDSSPEGNLSPAPSVSDGADAGAPLKGEPRIKEETYWAAVNRVYQRVIEETQPNYTVMQRAGIQRSDNEVTKTLTMFTTQRFQNYGILADAVGDYRAQAARYKAEASAENKAELARAQKNLTRAASSQVVQTAVFALMKIGADFLLHRWDREQDENGDVTAASVWKRFMELFTESAAGNFLFGSEIYSAIANYVNGTDYDVLSAANITAANELLAAGQKVFTLMRKDTGGMDEEELEAYHRKLLKAWSGLVENAFEVMGIPAGNARKLLQAVAGYTEDVIGLVNGEGFTLNGVPSSATGQYDRLYNAIQQGDAEEVQAALGKLDQMGKSGRVDSELKKRLKNYDDDIQTAAVARNEGDDKARIAAAKRVLNQLYTAYGISPTAKIDAEKREWAIDMVTGTINSKGDELLAGGSDLSVYDDLTEALRSGRTKDVQEEIDRLRTAGKDADSIKSKITDAVKSEYLAGSRYDREKLEKLLLNLNAGGKNLYEEKNFANWVKQAEKAQENPKSDPWAGLR